MDWKKFRMWFGCTFSSVITSMAVIAYGTKQTDLIGLLGMGFLGCAIGLCFVHAEELRPFIRRWTVVGYTPPWR